MRILFDTNVILDHLLARKPHDAVATQLMAAVDTHQLVGLLGSTTVTTIFYLCEKHVGAQKTRQHMAVLLSMFEVAPVDRAVLTDALSLTGFADYEDAVLHEAARHAGAGGIVTRDPKGFAHASLHVYSPPDLFLMLMAASR